MQTLSRIVEVCVFRIESGAPEYLILQRSSVDDLYPGLWQFVTGTLQRSEAGKEAALRELKEETGISAKRFWIVPYVDSYYDSSKDAVQLVPVFAAQADAQSGVVLSSEHQMYEWMKYREAIDRLVWPGQKHVVKIVEEYIVGEKEAGSLLEIKII
jgi:dATP pyrophosphohydrolase